MFATAANSRQDHKDYRLHVPIIGDARDAMGSLGPAFTGEAFATMSKAGNRPPCKQMRIHPEAPEDCSAIESVHTAAFRDHPYSRQTEHLIVNALRADHALAVSLVAEVGGKVVGHIAFSRITINGQACMWFLLGPVGVLPDHQRHGIGQQLVRQGLKEIRKLGADGCVLVGDPAYYSRFGFTQARELVFEGVPAEYCLYLPMSQQIPRGSVSHHPAFSLTG